MHQLLGRHHLHCRDHTATAVTNRKIVKLPDSTPLYICSIHAGTVRTSGTTGDHVRFLDCKICIGPTAFKNKAKPFALSNKL